MSKQFTLQTSDAVTFKVDESFVAMSTTLNTMIQSLGLAESENPMIIPLPLVDSRTMRIIIRWALLHYGDDLEQLAPKKLPAWDEVFFFNISTEDLFSIVQAANYLDMPLLLDYSTTKIADMLRNKSTEEMRTLFNVENDISLD